MLVSGYSGIGKTSLIQELYKPIVRQRGYFIAGKFDQVVRNIPYGAFTQALRSLVWQLLTESEDRLAEWRARLPRRSAQRRRAGGGHPGNRADSRPAGAAAAARSDRGAQSVRVRVPAASSARSPDETHPLVVFLDDLQWVDAATLDLLHALLTGPDIHHLLLIGAYRDNEVDAGHLLTWAVNRLESSGARVSRVVAGPARACPISPRSSATPCIASRSLSTARRLDSKKTDGNPFFVIQFLKTLEQEGRFVFDHEQAGWSFRMEAIATAGMTDNVVDLMTRKIRRLSAHAQRVADARRVHRQPVRLGDVRHRQPATA